MGQIGGGILAFAELAILVMLASGLRIPALDGFNEWLDDHLSPLWVAILFVVNVFFIFLNTMALKEKKKLQPLREQAEKLAAEQRVKHSKHKADKFKKLMRAGGSVPRRSD